MAAQNLIPGIGWVNETETKQNLVPGLGWVNETFQAGGSVVGSYTGTGGILFGGVAPLAKTKDYLPSGGVVFAGTAVRSLTKAFLPTGGIVFSGSAGLAKIKVYSPAGGILFGGIATTIGPGGPAQAQQDVMVGFMVDVGRMMTR